MAKSTIIRRLEALERSIAPPKRQHVLWGDNDAQAIEKINGLISRGEAGANDEFVIVRWKSEASEQLPG